MGVYARGGTEVNKPSTLEKYAAAIVSWNEKSIMDAIDGTANAFENPDGTSRSVVHAPVSVQC